MSASSLWGTNTHIKALAGENTRMMDLEGATVLPGINDAHCHLNGFGLERPPMQLDLGYPTIKSIADLKAAAVARKAEVGPGKWITGWGWDRGFLEETRHNPDLWPSRYDLDAVCPDNPVAFTEFSGHVLLVNSKALEIAGINKNSPPPAQGFVQRDAAGEPTGILFEMTFPVRELIPPPTENERKAAILYAMAELNSLGNYLCHRTRPRSGNCQNIYRSVQSGKIFPAGQLHAAGRALTCHGQRGCRSCRDSYRIWQRMVTDFRSEIAGGWHSTLQNRLYV